jgi:uncharacterized 2Fe-2S/4Fe-4S cluster protein (DUF4445 family)
MTCAACSAGPAFEGGGIKHGMRATEGAIEDFNVNPSTFEPMLLTIGAGLVWVHDFRKRKKGKNTFYNSIGLCRG